MPASSLVSSETEVGLMSASQCKIGTPADLDYVANTPYCVEKTNALCFESVAGNDFRILF